MSATEELARHLVRPAGEDLHVVQGTVIGWDPVTFANVINVDGVDILDVPVASGVEALTYQPGDVVLLEGWFPGGKRGELGIGTYWIRGRVITPGTGAADKTIEFLRTQLARELSVEIFQERVKSARIPFQEALDDTGFDFVDLATPGPSVEADIVTGVALLFVSAIIQVNLIDPTFAASGNMAFEVSGATMQDPLFSRSLVKSIQLPDAGASTETSSVGAANMFLLTDLNVGLNTFTAKYNARSSPADGVDVAIFSSRSISVFAF